MPAKKLAQPKESIKPAKAMAPIKMEPEAKALAKDAAPFIQPRKGVPNVAIRTSLFSVASLPAPAKRIADSKMDEKVIINGPGKSEIFYWGSRLNQNDRDVWMLLIDEARKHPPGLRFEVSLSGLLGKLGIKNTYKNRKDLWDRILMLAHGRIRISGWSGIGTLVAGLLSAKETQEDFDVKNRENRYFVGVDEDIPRLFISSLTVINFQRRASLPRLMSKWLHDFISSQKNDDTAVPVVSLMEWMGSENRAAFSFNQKLRQAIKDLADCSPPLLDGKAPKPWNDIQDGMVRFRRVKGQGAKTWNNSPEVGKEDLPQWWQIPAPL